MSERRFTDKPELNPQAVRSLPADHPAMVENRTLCPSSVVEVTESEPARVFISGDNNRKIGKTVQKAPFKNWLIYMLSLEERATCPTTCDARGYCYGNGMQLARRHRIGDPEVFYDRIGMELAELCHEAEEDGIGILMRLHVLGDFPDVAYVEFWADALREYSNLAVYGYTHWPKESEVGTAIDDARRKYRDRFRIRWSTPEPDFDSATVIDFIPDGPIHENVIVCPAQTDATSCCATCGLCWSSTGHGKTIAFVKHGPKSANAELEAVTAQSENTEEDDEEWDGFRAVEPLKLSNLKPADIGENRPEFHLINPESLAIEESYQRNLSGASIRLIRRIVDGWNWRHFKPPIVAETNDYYIVIDGQHTAIAAATHPDIEQIPCIVMKSDAPNERAAAFVAQNTHRVAVNALQVFHAEFVAGERDAVTIYKLALECECDIPRSVPVKGKEEPGQFVCVGELRSILNQHGSDTLRRVMTICRKSEIAKIQRIMVRSLKIVLAEAYYEKVAALPDETLAEALSGLDDLDANAQGLAASTGYTKDRAGAEILATAAKSVMAAA